MPCRFETRLRQASVPNEKEVLRFRGGSSTSKKSTKRSKTTTLYSTIAILLGLSWHYSAQILAVLSYARSQQMKSDLLHILQKIEKRGLAGVVLYTLCFAAWEGAGMPTAIVETFAGMTFGIKWGILANAAGKTLGAMTTFALGRYFFLDKVKRKFNQNEILHLATKSSTQHPLKVSLIIRIACFPELLKLLMLAVLPIHPRVVLLATLMHGVPFTVVWSLAGAAAGRQLGVVQGGGVVGGGVTPTSSPVVKIATLAALVFGIVVSPTVFGAWVAELRREHLQSKDK